MPFTPTKNTAERKLTVSQCPCKHNDPNFGRQVLGPD